MISKKKEEELTQYGIKAAKELIDAAYDMGLTWEQLEKSGEFMSELHTRIIRAITSRENPENESGRYKFTHEKMSYIISKGSNHCFDSQEYNNKIFERLFANRYGGK